jgi:hypothetical protein
MTDLLTIYSLICPVILHFIPIDPTETKIETTTTMTITIKILKPVT